MSDNTLQQERGKGARLDPLQTPSGVSFVRTQPCSYYSYYTYFNDSTYSSYYPHPIISTLSIKIEVKRGGGEGGVPLFNILSITPGYERVVRMCAHTSPEWVERGPKRAPLALPRRKCVGFNTLRQTERRKLDESRAHVSHKSLGGMRLNPIDPLTLLTRPPRMLLETPDDPVMS